MLCFIHCQVAIRKSLLLPGIARASTPTRKIVRHVNNAELQRLKREQQQAWEAWQRSKEYVAGLFKQRDDLNARIDYYSGQLDQLTRRINDKQSEIDGMRSRRERGSGTWIRMAAIDIRDYKSSRRTAADERRRLIAEKRTLSGQIQEARRTADAERTNFNAAKDRAQSARRELEHELRQFGDGTVGGDPKRSTHPVYGLTADGQEVTFAQSKGAGHTYLATGHIPSADQYWGPKNNKGHDHYNGRGGASGRGKYTGEGS
jgi:hypothetical protein